jgi:predicted metal-dependent hydrolase
MPTEEPDDVIFEYIQIGNSTRVVAVDAVTGTEVTVQVPSGMSSFDMQNVALKKLTYVLEKQRRGEDEPTS